MNSNLNIARNLAATSRVYASAGADELADAYAEAAFEYADNAELECCSDAVQDTVDFGLWLERLDMDRDELARRNMAAAAQLPYLGDGADIAPARPDEADPVPATIYGWTTELDRTAPTRGPVPRRRVAFGRYVPAPSIGVRIDS